MTLPERPTPGSPPSKAILVKGQLHPDTVDLFGMALDTSLCDLPAQRTFEVVPLTDQARTWGIRLTAAGDGAPAATGLATLKEILALISITNEGEVGFRWSSDAALTGIEQLQNAVLRLTHKGEEHAVALRQPQVGAPLRLDFTSEVIFLPLDVQTLPLGERIRCELTALDNVHEPLVEPKDKVIALGQAASIKLEPDILMQCHFDHAEEGGLALQLSGQYRATEGSRRYNDFNKEEVNKGLKLLSNTTSKNLSKLQTDIRNYWGATQQIPKLQARFNEALKGNLDAGQSAQATQQLENARRIQKSAKSGIKRIANSLPNSYDALGRLYEIARQCEELSQVGQIQYRIVGQAGSAEVVLLTGEAKPPKLHGPIVVAGFDANPMGDWIRTRNGLVAYKFAAGGQCAVLDIDNGRLAQGRWSATGNSVAVEVPGLTETFRIISPLELRSGAGLELYRVIN